MQFMPGDVSQCITCLQPSCAWLGLPRTGVKCRTGIGGSALEAEVNRTEVPARYCDRKTNGYRLLFLALNEAARPRLFRGRATGVLRCQHWKV